MFQTISDIRSVWERKVAPVKNECVLRSGVKEEVVDEFYKYGLLPDDPTLKCYFRCNAIEFQTINSAGEINAKIVADNFDYVNYQLAQKCASIIEPDSCEKVYRFLKCLHDYLSERFSVNGFIDIKQALN